MKTIPLTNYSMLKLLTRLAFSSNAKEVSGTSTDASKANLLLTTTFLSNLKSIKGLANYPMKMTQRRQRSVSFATESRLCSSMEMKTR